MDTSQNQNSAGTGWFTVQAPPSPQWSDRHQSCAHAVQFYSDDNFLVDSIAQFMAPALANGDAALIVASPQHCAGVTEQLSHRGSDLQPAIDQKRYIALDARETLSRFMRDGHPDGQLFRAALAAVLERARAAAGHKGRVLIFGEMVALLWADGNREAAISLEQLWNELGKIEDFQLLCGYPLKAFRQQEDRDNFRRICEQHSLVIPAEGYSQFSTTHDRLQAISALQQETVALESQLAELRQTRAQAAQLQNEKKKLLEEVSVRQRTEVGLRTLTARLLMMRDEERRRVARELHDSVAQLLAALTINMGILDSEKTQLSPRAAEVVHESTSVLGQLIEQVRALAHFLHPPTLDDMGLVSALQWYVEAFSERSRIHISLDFEGDWRERLPRELEIATFRIVQESLTNIRRHSGSLRGSVTLTRSIEDLQIAVRDSGKGLGGNNSHAPAGVGITGMRERAHQLGGSLQVESSAQGTSVLARLPIPNSSATQSIPAPVAAKVASEGSTR